MNFFQRCKTAITAAERLKSHVKEKYVEEYKKWQQKEEVR